MKIKSSIKLNYIFFGIFLFLLLLSIASTYYKFIVLRDFVVIEDFVEDKITEITP